MQNMQCRHVGKFLWEFVPAAEKVQEQLIENSVRYLLLDKTTLADNWRRERLRKSVFRMTGERMSLPLCGRFRISAWRGSAF